MSSNKIIYTSFITLISTLLLTFSSYSSAVEIVRVKFDYNNMIHEMDIELFDADAPDTVTNFLTYTTDVSPSLQQDGNFVDVPKYNNTFISSSVPGKILQAGGYTFRPPFPLDPLLGSLIHGDATVPQPVELRTVPVRINSTTGTPLTVVNEFKPENPNLRGTIAMAKIPNQPDSATREWFINLEDNPDFDTKNGGFTVFGKIIDDGITIPDEIASYPIHKYAGAVLNKYGSFFNLPVVNYDIDLFPVQPTLRENLVMIESITSINRPILRTSPNNADFSLVVNGNVKSLTITLSNTGNENLNIETIDTSSLAPQFSKVNDNCTATPLEPVSITPASACTITLEFSPDTLASFNSSILINYKSTVTSTTYSTTLPLSGDGVPQNPVLNVSSSNIIFANTIVNNSTTVNFTITNRGGDPLTITNAITIDGKDAGVFSLSNNGCTSTPTLLIAQSCTLDITFSPTVQGAKNATLLIQSNAGDSIISLQGTAIIPEISVNPIFSIVAEIGNSRKKFLIVTNSGSSTLVINNATISGQDAALFTQENNCPDTNNSPVDSASLEPGGSCRFLIQFTQTTGGDKTAILTIESNDPVNPSATISLNGTGEKDTDGIPDAVEATAPNNGDANNDGIPDETQNDVASLLAPDSGYITFISDKAKLMSMLTRARIPTILTNIQRMDTSTLKQPNNTTFNSGLYSYSIAFPLKGDIIKNTKIGDVTITNDVIGDGVDLAILLPPEVKPTQFYIYGPTPDNTTPHWYDFAYDENTLTGAQFFGEVSISGLPKNLIIVSYIDGKKGDDDLLANGIIRNNQIGIVSTTKTDSNSGAMLWMLFLIPLSILIYRR